MESKRSSRPWSSIYFSPRTWPFWGVHITAVVGIAVLGWSWSGFALAIGMYYLRMFFVTAGYHRYFSHRTFKTSRFFQFVLALGGTMNVQKGVLWWAAHHRDHHRYSDENGDLHSPHDGFLFRVHPDENVTSACGGETAGCEPERLRRSKPSQIDGQRQLSGGVPEEW